MPDINDKWYDIADQAIEKARDVDCELPGYIDGLKYMIELLGDELAAAKESMPGEEE